MGGFRIGRKFATHTYPVSPGLGGANLLFARNSAQGPDGDFTITDKTLHPIVWHFVDAPPGISPTANVPITPKTTGVVVVTGMIGTVRNNDASNPASIQLFIDASGITPHPQAHPIATVSLQAASEGGVTPFAAIPFLVEIFLPVGVTTDLQFQVQANSTVTPNLTITNLDSRINVQEVPVSTG